MLEGGEGDCEEVESPPLGQGDMGEICTGLI